MLRIAEILGGSGENPNSLTTSPNTKLDFVTVELDINFLSLLSELCGGPNHVLVHFYLHDNIVENW